MKAPMARFLHGVLRFWEVEVGNFSSRKGAGTCSVAMSSIAVSYVYTIGRQERSNPQFSISSVVESGLDSRHPCCAAVTGSLRVIGVRPPGVGTIRLPRLVRWMDRTVSWLR